MDSSVSAQVDEFEKKQANEHIAVNDEGINWSLLAESQDRSVSTFVDSNVDSDMYSGYFGNIVRYRMEDDHLVAELPAQVTIGDFIGTVEAIYSYEDQSFNPYTTAVCRRLVIGKSGSNR